MHELNNVRLLKARRENLLCRARDSSRPPSCSIKITNVILRTIIEFFYNSYNFKYI